MIIDCVSEESELYRKYVFNGNVIYKDAIIKYEELSETEQEQWDNWSKYMEDLKMDKEEVLRTSKEWYDAINESGIVLDESPLNASNNEIMYTHNQFTELVNKVEEQHKETIKKLLQEVDTQNSWGKNQMKTLIMEVMLGLK